MPFLCLKETEREPESKEKSCLPFELLSDAGRDHLSVAWASAAWPVPQPPQGSATSGAAGAEEEGARQRQGVALGRSGFPACPSKKPLAGYSPVASQFSGGALQGMG